MIEKLKELLGEELAKSVTEKLGKVELAIMNDGTVVPADKFDSLKVENKTLTDKHQTDISEMNTKLEEAVKNASDYDTLKGTLDTLKADNLKAVEQHKTETANIKRNSDADVALLKANVKESYLDMVKSQMGIDKLNYDGDTLVGLNDSIKSAQENFPDLFGEVKKVGAPPAGDPQNPPIGKKQQLVEQYNEAEKAGNARLMMSLSTQIQNTKE